MEKLGTLCLSLILLSLTQIQYAWAVGSITSITSPTASSLNVKWASCPGATRYMLNLRIENNFIFAPVVVTLSSTTLETVVQGLQPGSTYEVTLTAFSFLNVLCTDARNATTVPARSQITFSKAISSTSLTFVLSSVTGADKYFLIVEELLPPFTRHNSTFTSLSGQVDGLNPSTPYNCFVFSSNQAGLGASSNIKTLTTLVQPPQGVSIVSTGRSSARLTWQIVSGVLLYQVRVTDDDPSVAPAIQNSTATSLDISNLEPCSTYTVGVSSLNAFLKPGEPSNVVYTTSTIDSVTSISVDYSCSSGTVAVTWVPVFGANSYRASVVDGNGTSLSCNSSSTSCQISMLRCGERYQTQVTALSDDCSSTSNTSMSFQTVPCAPVNLTTYRTCGRNIIVLTWNPTIDTRHYVATSVSQTGERQECRPVGTTCYFTNTACGNFYTFTVYAVTSGCNSGISEPVTVKTSPCFPTNIRTLAQCDSEVLTTTWELAAGALSYFVEARGNQGDRYNCTTNTSSCALSAVACGEVLSVFLTAFDNDCNTGMILGQSAETVPCTPTNVTASTDCRPDSATVTWVTSRGAAFYIAVATNAAGTTRSCQAVGTECLIQNLGCGQTYNATVVATNFKCNSTLSEQVSIETAPCPPFDIEALLDCEANQAVIVWQSEGPTGSYVASLEDRDGGRLNCSSTDVRNCTIVTPRCGQTYSVNVTYDDGRCSATSAPISMESVPCALQDLSASVACDSGYVTANWTAAPPELNYTAVITSETGERVLCKSTQPQCTQGGLACGRTYAVTAFSVRGSCRGLPGAEVTVQQVPCPPTNVTVTRTCGSTVDVTWSASLGADRYTAAAVGNSSERSECHSDGTSCSIVGLLCGQVYTVGVVAADANCTSNESLTVTLSTVPCPPVNLASELDCSSDSALLSWSASPNAVSYSGSAVGPSGAPLSCNSFNTSCRLSGLVCGRAYNLSVSASDGTCVSPYSAPLSQESAPCAPVAVETQLNCSTNILTVSWDAAAAPLSYTVTASAGGATAMSCNTGGGSCSLSGLQCGQRYNVTVMAARGSCNGSSSVPQTVQTAPCVPTNLHANLNCSTDVATMTWSSSRGASQYTVTAVTDNGGPTATCQSTGLSCELTTLECGWTYTAVVRAYGNNCSSAASQSVDFTTEPCAPQNVMTRVDCENNASVSWSLSQGALSYIAVLQSTLLGGHSTSCSSDTTSCNITSLSCGETYSVTVAAEGQTCNSSQSSGPEVKTAPCVPTNLHANLNCSTDVATMTWSSSRGASQYTVTAVTVLGGPTATCQSTGLSCELTTLECGWTYTAVVTAHGNNCSSAPSQSVDFKTAPCMPTILDISLNCVTDVAQVNWTSAVGAESYIVQAQTTDGYNASCSSNGTTCSLSNLVCGQNYSVVVIVVVIVIDSGCPGHPSTSVPLITEPCAPQNVMTRVDCENNASVSWSLSQGALSYIAVLQSTLLGGHSTSCSSDTTSCNITSLSCGETYSVTVAAEGQTCNSSQSSGPEVKTGPCVPTNLHANLNCSTDIATMTWSSSRGASQYTVTAVTNIGGPTATCQSTGLSCDLTMLECGWTYTAVVRAHGNNCSSAASQSVDFKTAPCMPTILDISLNCVTDVAQVNWTSAVGAESYIVQAQTTNGYNASCSSNGTTCSPSNLVCGQNYSVVVIVIDSGCPGRPSTSMPLITEPCAPQNVKTRVDCENNASVSWSLSPGALSYIAVLQSTLLGGHSTSCSSDTTSCNITSLSCGETYTVTVTAEGQTCNSSQSSGPEVKTAPCVPTNLHANLNCSTDVATMTWSSSRGASQYTVTAVTVLGGPTATCQSTGLSCELTTLECGWTYTAVVTAHGNNCSSAPSQSVDFKTVPCVPTGVKADMICLSNTVNVTWLQSSGSEYYTATLEDSNGLTTTCQSAGTWCNVTGVECGQIYHVTVAGSDSNCTSQQSASAVTQSVPCLPSDIEAVVDCPTGSANVSWQPGAGATYYMVMATTWSGHNDMCTTDGTHCELLDLECGKNYTVRVTAVGEVCNSTAQMAGHLITASCPITGLTSELLCGSDSASLSWTPVASAMGYEASASSSSGDSAACSSANATCVLTDLLCGETYTASVVSWWFCHGAPSAPITFHTALCPPTNLRGSVLCDTNVLSLSWNASPVSGASYTLHSQKLGGDNTAMYYPTSDTSLDVDGLQCGQRYVFSIAAADATCNSSRSPSIELDTAPCRPTGLAAHVDCGTNRANLSWVESAAASYYIAEVTGEYGHVASCMSNQTSCSVRLQCGRTYTATLVAATGSCNSSLHDSIEFDSAPCLPENVVAVLDCKANVLAVTWQQNPGYDTYTALAMGSNGYRASCNSSATSCTIEDLQCGQTYGVVVTTSSVNCSVLAESDYMVQSAPCKPQNTSVRQECGSNDVVVTWDHTSTAQNYTVMATSAGPGQNYSCSSNETSCSFLDLNCGQNYTFTVMGHTNVCMSELSDPMELLTAPCMPTILDISLNCVTDVAQVNWTSAVGAESYIVQAQTTDGYNTSCSSNGTTCSLSNLVCGQVYSVVVMVIQSDCPGRPSTSVPLITEPCAPQNVKTRVDCENNASVSWSLSQGALSYIAVLQSTLLGGHSTSCSSDTTSCNITSLSCGETYTVTVTAEGQTCNSSQSSGPEVKTAPCVPTNLHANLNCSTDVATMTWSRSRGASQYTVKAVTNIGGPTATCQSTGLSCDLTMLECGRTYTAVVTAHGNNCSSAASQSVDFNTVPCVPTGVKADMICLSNTVNVTWLQSSGSEYYTATLEDSNGLTTTCQSAGTWCNVTGVECGQIYHVTVAGSDSNCTSQQSASAVTQSVPCLPSDIDAVVDCPTNSAIVSWQPGAGAAFYEVVATNSSGHSANCATATGVTNCELLDLECGENYVVRVTAVGEVCNSTAQMAGHLITEPCIPTHLQVSYTPPIAQLSWDTAKGAVSYYAQAVSEQGLTSGCLDDDTNCVINALECGQTYNLTVTAINPVCNVTSEPLILMTEPCPPNNVQARMVCENLTAIVSWEQSAGALRYIARLDGRNGDSASCATTDAQTHCEAWRLDCGTVYTVQVVAIGAQYNSSWSTAASLTSAPCLPSSVDANVHCDSDSAQLSWSFSEGADNYTLVATGNGGDQASCTTQQNSCSVTGLTCGERYDLSLTAANQECELTVAVNTSFYTRPCAPQHVSANLQCGSRKAVLSWEELPHVELYEATATQWSGGHVYLCNTTGGSCEFPDLACGEKYNLTVRAYSSGCWSVSSSTVNISTAPCQPTSVSAEFSCNSSTVRLSWLLASGALSYNVSAVGNLGYEETYLTSSVPLWVELPCGQTYDVTVQGQDLLCYGPPSAPATFSTVPCVPQDVQTYVECESHVGSVSWAPAEGADSYNATAVGPGAETYVCVTDDTNCTWSELRCGVDYTVRVTSQDGTCTSAPSNATIIHMDPCVPQGLKADPEGKCLREHVYVSWNASLGAETYTVAASHWIELNTNETVVHLHNLTCGQMVYLTVTAASQECTSAPSGPLHLQTEPCPPTSVTTSLDCPSKVATATWQNSNGSDYYTATFQTDTGLSETCTATKSPCSVDWETCGQNISVSVTASVMTTPHHCHSIPSLPSRLQSVPCVPTNVSVDVVCGVNEAVVSWSASQGAVWYSVSAYSTQGHVTCHSDKTTCTLSNLTCSTSYTVQVVARRDDCSSMPSQNVTFWSVPCVPANVQGRVNCSTGDVSVSWDLSYRATNYTAMAQGHGGYTSFCNTSEPGETECVFSDLLCGDTYSITVSATDDSCRSDYSSPITVETVACEPQNVSAVLDCYSNTAVVSWETSERMVLYRVIADSAAGDSVSCSSSDDSCTLPSMQCGQRYNLTVTVVDGVCNNSQSELTLHSAPCPPAGLLVAFQCTTQTAELSWSPSAGAMEYYGSALAENGTALGCESSGSNCSIAGLECGAQYNFSVLASYGTCNSSYSEPLLAGPGPCPPSSVQVKPLAMRNETQTLRVSWAPVHCSGPIEYLVELTGHLLAGIDAQFQVFSYWTSSTFFEIPLPCGSAYNATVVARTSSGGTSLPSSPPVSGTTAPCSPVNATFSGTNSSGTLSWQPSLYAEVYTAYDISGVVRVQLCVTVDLSCSFTNATNTNGPKSFEVTASNSAGESDPPTRVC